MYELNRVKIGSRRYCEAFKTDKNIIAGGAGGAGVVVTYPPAFSVDVFLFVLVLALLLVCGFSGV